MPRERGRELPQLLHLIRLHAGGADHHVHAALQAQARVLEHGGGHGEVDHDVGLRIRERLVERDAQLRVGARDQLHVVRALDRAADRLAHAPRGARRRRP